jgi:AcrR family transcriptional regulator
MRKAGDQYTYCVRIVYNAHMTMTQAKRHTRGVILEACRRALARHGYQKLTMADVADEAHLAKRTLYLYYKTKEEMVGAAVDDYVGSARQRMMDALADRAPGREKLRQVMEQRVLVRLEAVGPFHHSIDDVVRALYPNRSEDYLQYFQPETEIVVRALRAGRDDGSLAFEDEEDTAEALIRATNGFFPSSIALEEMRDPAAVRRRLSLLVDLLVRGLSTGKGERDG